MTHHTINRYNMKHGLLYKKKTYAKIGNKKFRGAKVWRFF